MYESKKDKSNVVLFFFLKRSLSEISLNPYQYLWHGEQIGNSSCGQSVPPGHPVLSWSPFNAFLKSLSFLLLIFLSIRFVQWFHHYLLGKVFKYANENKEQINGTVRVSPLFFRCRNDVNRQTEKAVGYLSEPHHKCNWICELNVTIQRSSNSLYFIREKNNNVGGYSALLPASATTEFGFCSLINCHLQFYLMEDSSTPNSITDLLSTFGWFISVFFNFLFCKAMCLALSLFICLVQW